MNQPIFSVENKVANIILSSPKTRNALTRSHIKLISEVLAEWEHSNIRALTIRGKGKVFCSGLSFDEFDKGDWSKNPISELCDLIERFPVPTICALHGGVYGGGVEIAISCDFRISDSRLKLAVPAAKLGINYGSKGIRRALFLLGAQNVRKMYLLGETFEIVELLKIGFVDYVGKDEEFVRFKVEEITNKLKNSTPEALRGMKKSIVNISKGGLLLENDFRRYDKMIGSFDL